MASDDEEPIPQAGGAVGGRADPIAGPDRPQRSGDTPAQRTPEGDDETGAGEPGPATPGLGPGTSADVGAENASDSGRGS